MFLASPTPMLNSLAKATTEFVDNHPDLPTSNTTETLAVVIQVFNFFEKFLLEQKY